MQDTLYKVTGGGFYRYTINKRTGRSAWRRNDQPLKRTERDTFTKQEADEIVARNNTAFIKMSNVTIMEI